MRNKHVGVRGGQEPRDMDCISSDAHSGIGLCFRKQSGNWSREWGGIDSKKRRKREGSNASI